MTDRRKTPFCLATAILLLCPVAKADLVFDTFDEFSHTVSGTGSNLSSGDVSTITSLGAAAGSGRREIVAAPGSVEVDTTGGGRWTGVGAYMQYRYGTFTTAGNQLNLDLSLFDGFEFDVLNVTNAPAFSLQIHTNANEHRFTFNQTISGTGTVDGSGGRPGCPVGHRSSGRRWSDGDQQLRPNLWNA